MSNLKQALVKIGRIALAAYAGLFILLYFIQDTLIFHPQPLWEGAREALAKIPGTVELTVSADDGTQLHGWIRYPERREPKGLVLYFGGNAEEVSGFVQETPEQLPAWSVASFNYRGYGNSAGKPSEAALTADARTIFDYLAARPDIDPQGIVAFGRSLGSGVATQLAHSRTVRGVVLVSPFDSLAAIAKREYPIVPVSILLRHPFDSIALAPQIDKPLIVLAGDADRLIPAANSKQLFAAWAGPKRMTTIPNGAHNDVHAGAGYWPAIRSFLNDL